MSKKKGIVHHTVRVELFRRSKSFVDLAKELGVHKITVLNKLHEPISWRFFVLVAKALGHDEAWLIRRCWEEYDIITSEGRNVSPPRLYGEYIPPRP